MSWFLDKGINVKIAINLSARDLIDRHITALDVRQVIPPSQITADEFKTKVEALPGAKAQASTMEHAIRHHIEVHFSEDPAEYQRLRD